MPMTWPGSTQTRETQSSGSRERSWRLGPSSVKGPTAGRTNLLSPTHCTSSRLTWGSWRGGVRTLLVAWMPRLFPAIVLRLKCFFRAIKKWRWVDSIPIIGLSVYLSIASDASPSRNYPWGMGTPKDPPPLPIQTLHLCLLNFSPSTSTSYSHLVITTLHYISNLVIFQVACLSCSDPWFAQTFSSSIKKLHSNWYESGCLTHR